jgi:hypothetical protein
MSKWLIKPDSNAIYKFAININNKFIHHYGNLTLENDNLIVNDLIRNKIFTYDISEENFSYFQKIEEHSIFKCLDKIKTFVVDSDSKEKFEDLFSESIYEINKEKIKIFKLLDLSSFQHYEDVLNEKENILILLKNKWLEKILESKADAINYIKKEIETCQDESYKLALVETKSIIEEYNYQDEIFKLKTIQEVISTWPSLLLPAPSFVNELHSSWRSDD